jgi:nucleotide-binding universal stress UspA family protein
MAWFVLVENGRRVLIRKGDAMKKLEKILAPTDLSELSLVGLRAAFELAHESGCKVIVYHVLCLDEFVRFQLLHVKQALLEKLLNKHRILLANFIEEHFSDLLPIEGLELIVEVGSPDENIVEKVNEENVDLIVISTHGRTGLSHMLTGSVTENVVRKSPCPVLSIRPQTEIKHVAAA